MYFTRAYHPANVGFAKIKQNKDVWHVKQNTEGEWLTSQNVEALNSESDNVIVGISASGDLYVNIFDHKKKELQYSIGKTSLKDGVWQKPEPIHIPMMEFSGDFSDFYINPEETIILFSIASDRGYGKEDLYVSQKVNGIWTTPKNLGSQINTVEHEFAPFLSKDGKHLFFTSTGWQGMGQGDVFMSTRQYDESWEYWTTPVNLGAVVNSKGMDCYFRTDGNGTYYLCSNRNEATGMDIYRLSEEEQIEEPTKDMLTVKGYVSDSVTNEFLTAEIAITDDETGDEIHTLSNRVGFYTVQLEKGKKYNFSILRAPYHEIKKEITTPAVEKQIEDFWLHFQLSKYEKGDKIELENLFFHTSTARLRDESKPIMNKLVTIMKSNESLQIRVEGHTDNSGSKASLKRLSKERAVAVKNELVENGIDPKRVKVKGYGGGRPLYKNDSEQNKRKNRRVEFVIL